MATAEVTNAILATAILTTSRLTTVILAARLTTSSLTKDKKSALTAIRRVQRCLIRNARTRVQIYEFLHAPVCKRNLFGLRFVSTRTVAHLFHVQPAACKK